MPAGTVKASMRRRAPHATATSASSRRRKMPARGISCTPQRPQRGNRGERKHESSRGRVVAARAEWSTINYAVSSCTFTMLFLGRFVFRDFQKKALEKQGLPSQNGVPHYEAGDDRALEQEAVVTASLNDPVGFSIVDVLSWGSLGHALGFALAVLSNNATIGL